MNHMDEGYTSRQGRQQLLPTKQPTNDRFIVGVYRQRLQQSAHAPCPSILRLRMPTQTMEVAPSVPSGPLSLPQDTSSHTKYSFMENSTRRHFTSAAHKMGLTDVLWSTRKTAVGNCGRAQAQGPLSDPCTTIFLPRVTVCVLLFSANLYVTTRGQTKAESSSSNIPPFCCFCSAFLRTLDMQSHSNLPGLFTEQGPVSFVRVARGNTKPLPQEF